MQVEGTIKMIGATQQITDNFSKREIVITTNDLYPQDVMFQAVNKICPALDNYLEGDKVVISFNLRGREWTSPTGEVKYFNTLDLWRIENVQEFGKLNNTNNFAESPSQDTINQKEDVKAADDDDLPF